MNRLLTIVHLTLHEALRKRILTATAICGAGFLVLYGVGFHFIVRNFAHKMGVMASAERLFGLSAFTLAGLYAVNFLTVMSAVLLPVDTLSGEIDSGVVQTIASKPVRRSEIVLGKWLAYVLVAGAYTLTLAGGVLLIARVLGHFTPPNVAIGLPLMLLESMLLVTLSIWGGARFSTVTNGVIAFGFYGVAFLGGWTEQIGSLLNNDAARNVGTVASLIMPSESLWQLAAHHMQPKVMAEMHLTPFSPASVPSGAMVVWAAGWTLVLLAAAVRGFGKRPL